MKVKTIIATILLIVAGIQMAKAQKVVLNMINNQSAEYNTAQIDSLAFTKQKVSLHFVNKHVAEYSAQQLDSITFVQTDSSENEDVTDPSVTGGAIDITNMSATLVGYASSIRDNLSNDLRVGFIYSLDGTPNKNNGIQVDVSANEVAEDGRYFKTITNLLSDATYYFRSFVYQSGLWFYGKIKSFVTDSSNANFATTGVATSITCFSAKVSGCVDIQSPHSTLECGVCYGTGIKPTLNDNMVPATSNEFALQLRRLLGSTIYYYRTYAIVDGQIYYGTVRTFRTLDDNVVETGTIDEETLAVTSRLTIGGGAYSSLVLGVCYGTTEQPTISNMTVTSDEVDEENRYTVKLPPLGYGVYYYRAYVLIDGVPHYGVVKTLDMEDQASSTLWDLISRNPSFSRFADIVQHTKYYKDDTHPVSTYSYADILNGGQINTIWVPDNSALTETEYKKWIQLCETDGYIVQQQFLGNHIALWRHNISEPGVDMVKMINGKNLEFDKTNKTLGGIAIGEYNIPTVNGVVHTLKGIAPFHYNFYESLKFRDNQTKFGKYVVSKDSTYFSSSSSIEGLPDENGNPTYVDSVYRTSNRLFETTSYLPEEGRQNWQMAEKCFGANINNEDSAFVMLMPTDAAWDATYENLMEGYNYATIYVDKTKGDLGINATFQGLNADSLQKMSIEMDMVAPLVFNIHKQPKIGGEKMWTIEDFKEDRGERAEYLLNTYGDTLRNIGDWKKSSLFASAEPIEMSNGIAYEVTSWDFPIQYYMPDVEVEVESTDQFYYTEGNKYKVGPGSKRYSFSNEAFKDITDVFGKVSNGNFYHLDAPGPTAAPDVEIKLIGNNPNAYVPNAQVMSGKYDIQVVVVPRWYIEIANSSKIDEKFYAIIDTLVNEDDITDTTFVRGNEIDMDYVVKLASQSKYKFKTQISYNNNSTKDKTSSAVTSTYEGVGVDTITVAKDFEFPYSYKNMRFSYPTLYIQGAVSRTDAKKGFVYDLVVDKIILKRKR